VPWRGCGGLDGCCCTALRTCVCEGVLCGVGQTRKVIIEFNAQQYTSERCLDHERVCPSFRSTREPNTHRRRGDADTCGGHASATARRGTRQLRTGGTSVGERRNGSTRGVTHLKSVNKSVGRHHNSTLSRRRARTNLDPGARRAARSLLLLLEQEKLKKRENDDSNQPPPPSSTCRGSVQVCCVLSGNAPCGAAPRGNRCIVFIHPCCCVSRGR